MSTTIIYLTDNKLNKRIEKACQDHLLVAAAGKRVISVSQKPIEFGDNFCVGDIGRSGLSIDKQLKVGLEQVTTKYVAIAEHDCVYSKEHFDWIPPDEHFYYNKNVWVLQFYSAGHPEWNGWYSHLRIRRWLQSQLIATTAIMYEATIQKISILSDPRIKRRWATHPRLGEPGIYSVERMLDVFTKHRFTHAWPEAKKYMESYTAKHFKTKTPNVDIRHENNHTRSRRGKSRRLSLNPWGTMENLLNG